MALADRAIPEWYLSSIKRHSREQRPLAANGHERDPSEWARAAWLLQSALVAYAQHRPNCGVHFLGGCSCGLDNVWQFAKAKDKLEWLIGKWA